MHSISAVSDPRLKHIPSDFSIDNLFHMLADRINEKLNFPIFVWRDHKHLQFEGNRFDKILDSITALLKLEDYEALQLQHTFRYGMAQTLNKIRLVEETPKGEEGEREITALCRIRWCFRDLTATNTSLLAVKSITKPRGSKTMNTLMYKIFTLP
jgi:hypothetical protein